MFPLDPLYMFLTLLSALGGGVHCHFFLASVILSDEDEDVAVDVDGVLGRHDAVLVLAGRVDQVQLVVVPAHVHALAERWKDTTSMKGISGIRARCGRLHSTVLDGRFVVVHELALDELDGQGRLACNAFVGLITIQILN